MALKSWVASANDVKTDFPIQNLPYGAFRHAQRARIGVAVGDQILDLHACADQGLLVSLPEEVVTACRAEVLNPLMSLGHKAWSALRRRLIVLLDEDQADDQTQSRVEALLIPMHEAAMQIPAQIGDYTDFYASIHHATRVGRVFRPNSPLLPNYKYVPMGYSGRASSIVVSGHPIRRPSGQKKSPSAPDPVFGPTQCLDYELEIGTFVGPGNPLGQSIPIAEAERHIFGLCLVNDWSARDIQSWEYQPLGPFLAKSFSTTISPWIVPMEALAPYRVPVDERPEDDPQPLDYLFTSSNQQTAFDVTLEVYLQSRTMRQTVAPPMLMSRGNLRDLYWSIGQLLTHHASNGCNLRPGDLIATGTISGPNEGSEGCLIEKNNSANAIRLPGGEVRTFLEDGDQVTFRAYAEREGAPRIGFGECTGTILEAM